MTQPTRVLFLGLDAASPALIDRWATAGLLPTFRSLMQRGLMGTTANPIGLYVGAVWPSFFTGVSPARHGRYCYEQLSNGSYEVKRFRAADLNWEPFWVPLSRGGRRVAVIDVPKSPLTGEIDGIHLVDWGTHDPDPDSEFRSWPAPLAHELAKRYGTDPVGDCNRIGRSAEEITAFCDDLTGRIDTKCAMCLDLLDQGSWDLFLAVFAESHCVGHQLWNLHDPTHPHHDAEVARKVGDPVQRVYVALDAAIGRLCEAVGPDTTVFVFTSHGMGAHYDATFLLDEILCRLENVQASVLRRGSVGGLKRLWESTPSFIRSACRPLIETARGSLSKRRGKGRKSLKKAMLTPERRRRKCFAIPNNDVYGGIRVNLIGREPHGRVHPGEEYERLFDQLRADLLEIVNVETGLPLARDLLRAADYYEGERFDDLPDFFVQWDRDHPVREVHSAKIGTIRREFRGVRTGDHLPEGRFYATGPTVQPGRLSEDVSVMDFAPTVASLLDVPLPDVDGRPIDEVTRGQDSQLAESGR